MAVVIVSSPNQPVFQAILVRQAPWKGLGGSTLAVGATYVVMMLGAVLLSGPVAKPEKKPQKELVVTLFEASKVLKTHTAIEAGGGNVGSSGSAEGLTAIIESPKIEAVAPTKHRSSDASKRKEPPKTKTAPTEPVKDVTGALAQPEPQKTQAPVSPQPSAAAAEPTAQVAGVSASPGVGTSGTGASPGAHGGTGTGTGLGTGGGTRMGVASGDTTVLPFMDGMTRPSLLSKVDPKFSREARDASAEGLILTKCVITTEGSLRRCRIIKSVPLMDQAVLAALSQWKYSPVLYQGKPTAVEYVIPVRLVLQ